MQLVGHFIEIGCSLKRVGVIYLKVTDVRICLSNLKKVESGLSSLSVNKVDIHAKKKLHSAMLEVCEVIDDLKERLKELEHPQR